MLSGLRKLNGPPSSGRRLLAAIAVPVATAAVSSSSGSRFENPPGPDCPRSAPEPPGALVVGVCVGLAKGSNVAVLEGVGVGPVEVAVGVDEGVGVRDGVGVREGVGVNEGVGDGPSVALEVEVRVAVAVGVGVRVLVAFGVGVRLGVEEGAEVGGGWRMVIEPLLVLTVTGLPDESDAITPDNDNTLVPGEALERILYGTFTSVPLDMTDVPP